MAAFMEESRIKVQDGRSYGNRSVRSHVTAVTFRQGPEVRRYLIGPDRLMS